jgi:hypothetical protein
MRRSGRNPDEENPMAEDETREAEDPTATPADEDDTEGHSAGGYEYARLHAREMARDAEAWASREAVRKEAKSRSTLDRLRGR